MSSEVSFTLDQLDELRLYDRTVVRILRKWEARNIKANNTLMGIELLLIDEKEDTIQCYMHHSFLQRFGDHLSEGSIIEICNFNVQSTIAKKYKVSPHKFYIKVTEITSIKSLGQDYCQIPGEKFHFGNYEDFVKKLCVVDELSDVIGYIVKVGKNDVRSRTNPSLRKVDLTLLIENGVKIDATIWGEQAELFEDKYRVVKNNNTVLIITSVIVKKFKVDIVLSPSSSTKFYFNHESEAVAQFRKRLEYNGDCPINLGTGIQLDELKKEEQQCIKDIWQFISSDNRKEKEFVCEGTITDVLLGNGWNYIACSTCSRKLAKTNTSLFCKICDKTEAVGVLRFKIEIKVDDGKSSSTFVIFDEEATKIIGKSAADIVLKDADDNLSKQSLDSIPMEVRSLIGKTYLFKIKVKEYDFDAVRHSFAVIKIQNKICLEDNKYEKKNKEHEDMCDRKRKEHEEEVIGGVQKKQKNKEHEDMCEKKRKELQEKVIGGVQKKNK